MALTKLDPNVIGQDSTGAGKITSAGGSVSIDSSGNVRIANNSANNVLFAANGTVGIGASTVVMGSNTSPSSYNNISIGTANNAGYRSDVWGNGGTVNPSFEQYVYDRQAGTGNQEVAYMTGRLNGSGKGMWNFQTKTSTSWMNTMTMLDGYVGIGTTAPDAQLKVTGISNLGGMIAGAPLNTTNNNDGCVLLHKLGQSQGFQFSGSIVSNSWTGQAFVTVNILCRYTDDVVEYQVLSASTLNTAIAKTTLQLVKVTYGGSSYLGIKKNGGGTGTIMLYGCTQSNTPYPFEVAGGSYTVSTTVATLN